MLEQYLQHEAERKQSGIPARPLDPGQTLELCRLLEEPPPGGDELLLRLIKERVSPGVDSAAQVKAEFLARLLRGSASSPLISRKDAVAMLGAMLGGYNVGPLVEMLEDEELSSDAARALSRIILVYDAFDQVAHLSRTSNCANSVLVSWAEAEWFRMRQGIPGKITVIVIKVDGEINTDDFSPASDAWSRPDIPLHALAMGRSRFPGGIETIARFRADGHQVAFVGDVIGTGSSRKSACNSLLWHIGEDIPGVPNKRTGGIIIGGVIAPIFFNTAQDSGALPLKADVTRMRTGDVINIDTVKGEITNKDDEVISTFKLSPATLPDEFRAGGRIPLIIGRALTDRARRVLGLPSADFFIMPENPLPKQNQGYTQAQKIVGKACGVPGVLPGTACEPKMTTVGSQDTTGPMTADELKELACLRFQAPLVMQSFCHTAAYPKPADVL
ncbi:MAG TPA: aconitate hydratase B, partial [Geobacteraceae bacterium]|nr:aconitate hydratase B [Geobacteraceae bacterium]